MLQKWKFEVNDSEWFLKDFKSELSQKQSSGNYRKIKTYIRTSPTNVLFGKKSLICFASNDYLGLSFHPKVKKAAILAIEQFGFGSGSSRFICGNNPIYSKLEKALAKVKKSEDALVFSSGFACASAIIPALIGKGDLIIADYLIHASLIDGSLASKAKLIRFEHNNLNHCHDLLAKNRQNFRRCLIISETVFSMDGDCPSISNLIAIAKKFDCLLLTDDAHGIGLEDKESNELAETSTFWIRMGTLSKAHGSLGGYVCGNRTLIDFLRNKTRSLIYSTALPASCLAAALAAVKLMQNQQLAIKTTKNAHYFCKLMSLPEPQSAIVPIIIGDNFQTLKIAELAKKAGFLIGAIRPPTVPVGSARLRISFCALHKKSEIKALAKALKSLIYTHSSLDTVS
jgi:8-amino-7-oxononanoate synthase